MLNSYCFTDRALQVDFVISLDRHHINYAFSKIIVEPNFPEIGNEVRCIKKIVSELYVIYARLLNQKIIKDETVFSARFDKQGENDQVLDETELFNSLIINHNLTQTDINNIDVQSQLEHQIQLQETKDSSWRFDKFI